MRHSGDLEWLQRLARVRRRIGRQADSVGAGKLANHGCAAGQALIAAAPLGSIRARVIRTCCAASSRGPGPPTNHQLSRSFHSLPRISHSRRYGMRIRPAMTSAHWPPGSRRPGSPVRRLRRQPGLRAELEARQIGYLLAVACDHRCPFGGTTHRADALLRAGPAAGVAAGVVLIRVTGPSPMPPARLRWTVWRRRQQVLGPHLPLPEDRPPGGHGDHDLRLESSAPLRDAAGASRRTTRAPGSELPEPEQNSEGIRHSSRHSPC